MKLTKSLLLGSAAAVLAVSAGYAADLPSKKAPPASYVKVCDAYGAGFFYIPGTDTCVKLGGYFRYELQYVPGQNYYTGTTGALLQAGSAQDTSGQEVRGRIDLDARTQSAWGTVQTAISLRGTNSSGLRDSSGEYNTTKMGSVTQTQFVGATNQANLTMEKAFIRFAGFTFGVAPENYALMPSTQYNANPWAGFPNGMRQLSYTAILGGGWSATAALEAAADHNFTLEASDTPQNAIAYVGNIRLDQSWGFAAIHAMTQANSYWNGALNGVDGYTYTAGGNWVTAPTAAGAGATNWLQDGTSSKQGYAVGATVKFNLPQLASGDALWLTANYSNGDSSGIMSAGAMNNLSSSSGGRVTGGYLNTVSNLVLTGGNGTAISPYTFDTTKGYNVAGQLTHYWAPQWRSNFTAGYVQFNPPTSSLAVVGKSTATEVLGSLIWSPVKDFDIGLETQYMKTTMDFNSGAAGRAAATAWAAAGSSPNANNITTKLRLERTF